jgi:hypothetical protein
MACVTEKIAYNLLHECGVNPIAGLWDEVVVINREDIDFANSQVDNTALKISDLKLKSGKAGFKISGVKDMHSVSFERANGKFGPYYKHKYSGVLLDLSDGGRGTLRQLLNSDVVIVARRKINDAAQFFVLGWNVGLKGTAHTYNSNDNSGAELFELATPELEDAGEPYAPYTLLEGDISATEAAFKNAFAS